MVEKKKEEEQPKKKLGDKIFGAHNNPTKDSDYSDNFDVDFSHVIIEDRYDEEEYLYKKKLEEAVYVAFQNSRWHPLSYKKKIPKDLIPHLFHEILEQMEETEFNFIEKFVSICDFVSLSYTKAYDVIPTKYKEKIVNELEIKYSVLSKRNISKLF